MTERWAETLRHIPDRYGRTWDMAPEDRCPECGQPMGVAGAPWRCIGGPDHERVFDDVVVSLGGTLP